jgi:hypothetical protein
VPLREFLYVDADRVRSLLAQLQGLILESLASPVDGSRSAQDLTFVAFEQLADEHLLVKDLGAPYFDAEQWRTGAVHKELRPGDLVRIGADVQVLDGGLFETRLQRLDALLDAYLTVTGQRNVPLGAQKNDEGPKPLGAQRGVAKKQAFGGLDQPQLQAIAEFVKAYVGESIAVRVLPCGRDQLDLGFTGALLGWKTYVQDDRDTLFSRYGNVASRWTAVLQVAAMPENGRDEVTVDSDVLDAAGNLSRAGVERVATQLLAMMEGIGIAEGPRWPSISVTPLAFYRDVSPAV